MTTVQPLSVVTRFLMFLAAAHVLPAGAIDAQVVDSTQRPAATILGRVVDTSGLVLPDVEISLLTDSGAVLLSALSAPDGKFVLHPVPAGGPYVVQARKIGYGPAAVTEVRLQGGDTLPITFRLPPGVAVLPEIIAKARGAPLSKRRITASEFNPRSAPNGLLVLGKYRPDMLGDPTVCPDPPQQPQWRDQEQSVASQDLFGNGNRPGSSFGRAARRPWLDSLYSVRSDPYSPYVLRVYINGIRRDYPGQSPLMILKYLPSNQIAEMYYADCNDEFVPIDMRYSVFVVLKPPTEAEQKRALQRLMPAESTKALPDSSTPAMRDSTIR